MGVEPDNHLMGHVVPVTWYQSRGTSHVVPFTWWAVGHRAEPGLLSVNYNKRTGRKLS